MKMTILPINYFQTNRGDGKNYIIFLFVIKNTNP